MFRTRWTTCPKKMGLREKVIFLSLERHEKQLEDIEQNKGDKNEKGMWLISKAMNLNPGYRLNTSHGKKIIIELFNRLTFDKHLYKIQQKLLDLEILIANLISIGMIKEFQGKSYRVIRMPIRISRSPNSYIKSTGIVTSQFIISLTDMLEDSNLLKQAKGYRNEREAKVTRIWPTKELLLMFKPFAAELGPVELVNLRDENKRSINYKDTDETNRIRAILRNASIVNREANVMIKTRNSFLRIETDLHAVFNNGSFDSGGRLYTSKNGYQSLSRSERKEIFINQEPTVELDFSGLHPRLLYAIEGIQKDGDIYDTIYPEHPELREIFKLTILAMINSKSDEEARKSCNKEFNYDGYYTYRPLLKKIGIEISDLINMVKTAHKDIAHHFCSVACYHLMNKDSKIALDIIEHFTAKGIPILAIHDSFIVTAHFKDELYGVMKAAYRKHTGSFDCPISQVSN
ncbi:MAG: hypothetical protein K4571_02400 [Deltaproteobacteria bacterium]